MKQLPTSTARTSGWVEAAKIRTVNSTRGQRVFPRKSRLGGSRNDAGLKITPTFYFPPALVFTGFSTDEELILAQDDSFRERVCRLTTRESPCTCTPRVDGQLGVRQPTPTTRRQREEGRAETTQRRRADGNRCRLYEADVP